MKTWITLLLVLSSGLPLHAANTPHVLMIAIDDLNDWIGCLGGHPQALTPNIDRLAKRGVLFTNAHCVAPACNPSRAALWSGRMPQVTKVWANARGQSIHRFNALHSLSTAFAEGGYHTLGTGKLLHSRGNNSFAESFNVGQRWSPLSSEQSEYTDKELPSKGTENPRHVTKDALGREVILPLNRMPSDRNPDKRSGESFDWGGWDVPDEDFGDTQITTWAIEQLQKKSDKPIFLAVGYYRPHIPLWAPQRFFDRFKEDPGQLPEVRKDDLDDLGEAGKKWAREPVTAGSHATTVRYNQWRQAVEGYLACVTYVDYEIGRLLDALDASAYAEDTAIMLWSDHGWHLGEKEHWGKWTGWERSTKVPMILAAAKNAPDWARDAACDQPVGLIDVYPTLVELCGLNAPKLDGQSLLPLLKNPRQTTGRAVLTTFNPGNLSLRTERWRYIRYEDGSDELYDLHNDPHEWTNLADKRPELRQTMVMKLERRLAEIAP